MSPTIERKRFWWPLAIVMAALFLSGCFNSDSDKKGVADSPKGEAFHGADWATIKNLDPRGEQCIDCHGNNADMSPFGGLAHNIGLKNNDTADILGVAGLKITQVAVDEATGEVVVTTNQSIPADANVSLTFAKLAPRVIHNRGHDWQNYFSSNALGFGENRAVQNGAAMMLANGGVQPQTVPSPVVSGNTITFNLGDGDSRSWAEHDFTVRSAYEDDTNVWAYSGVLGTKVQMTDVATHMYCNAAHADANQLSDVSENKPVCWWPDGSHLVSGVFATEMNEFVVAYEPDLTHRVALIIGGSPGYNTWFDFVPSVANGDKTPGDFTADDTSLAGIDYIDATTGAISAADYVVSEGNRAPGGSANNATHGHQSLPAAREVVDVKSCNSCHDSLSMHGGSRATTQTCVTCHNPGNLQASSGRSVDFKQLVHRIHRGANLPSEKEDIAALMAAGAKSNPAAEEDGSLVAAFASDFTKVRFPQGPTPGTAAGITNCVKCHMGADTKDMVQGLASDVLGADENSYDVQEKLKLAMVTPQGDNWLTVRSVNACQACHDSNVWLGEGSINGVNQHRSENGNRDPADPAYKLDKYMAFYSDKYAGIGFDWLGKKEGRTQGEGWVHNTNSADDNSRFTCGSSGGCHGNNAVDTLNVTAVGNRLTNAVQQVHLELNRRYLLAERFSIEISNEQVAQDANGKYAFTAEVQIIDSKTQSPVAMISDGEGGFSADIDDPAYDAFKTLGPALPDGRQMFTGYLAWMNDSPDYNQSAGKAGDDFTEIPGATVNAPIEWSDGSSIGVVTVALESLPNKQWAALKNNLDKVVGTLVVRGSLGDFLSPDGTINLQTATKDFRFDNQALAANEGRRKVVDFTFGSGVGDGSADAWDKEHGANTQSCSSCHLELSMHAGVTNNVQACVTCHNPQRTDINSRTKRGSDLEGGLAKVGIDGQYEESLDLKRLVHNIHAAGDGFRLDPFSMYGLAIDTLPGNKGNSFPGKLSNCQSCHVQDDDSGLWTFDLAQLPEGLIGSTAITADWAQVPFKIDGGPQHDLANHMKMSPIASVCSSCHDAGYKTGDGRMNENIIDGGPYVGSHWWVMGGVAPGVVAEGEAPASTKHQSGK